MENKAVTVQCGVGISVLSVKLRNAIYNGACRNATTAVCVHDLKVEMESTAERRRRLTRV